MTLEAHISQTRRSTPEAQVPPGILDWLLEEGEPSIRYFTLVDLLDNDEASSRVLETKELIGKKGWAAKILVDQKNGTYWDNPVSCYVPKWSSSVWQLIALADLGVSGEDPRVKGSIDHFLDLHNVDSGGFALRPRGSENFKPHICMTGNMVRALTRFGFGKDERVARALDWLVGEQLGDGGWNCFTEDGGKHGSFKATIEPLWAFSEILALKRKESWSQAAQKGMEFLLRHRVYKSDRDDSPVLLEFLITHYPLHYHYDFLHGLRVLTGLGVRGDSRIDDALKLLVEKRLPDGRWLLDGVFRGWRQESGIHGGVARPEEREIITHGWGTGRTQQIEEAGKPSKWITLQALLVLKRLGLLNMQ